MTKEIFKNQKELIIAFKETFQTPTGQKVLKTIGKMCGKDENSFDVDPLVMAFRAAKRDAYLEIQRLVDFDIVINHKNKAADSDQIKTSVDDEEIDPLN
jgi:hypothetical protein